MAGAGPWVDETCRPIENSGNSFGGPQTICVNGAVAVHMISDIIAASGIYLDDPRPGQRE